MTALVAAFCITLSLGAVVWAIVGLAEEARAIRDELTRIRVVAERLMAERGGDQ